MGCSSSSGTSVRRSTTVVDISNVDLSKKEKRPVRDLAVFQNRLQEIDYEAVIAEGQDWKDPHFKANVHALIDESMMRNNRIT